MSLPVLNFLQDLKKRDRIFYLLVMGYQDALEKLPPNASPSISNALSELYEQSIVDFLQSSDKKSKQARELKPITKPKPDPLKAIDDAFDEKLGRWELSSSDGEEGIDVSDDDADIEENPTDEKLLKGPATVMKLIKEHPAEDK